MSDDYLVYAGRRSVSIHDIESWGHVKEFRTEFRVRDVDVSENYLAVATRRKLMVFSLENWSLLFRKKFGFWRGRDAPREVRFDPTEKWLAMGTHYHWPGYVFNTTNWSLASTLPTPRSATQHSLDFSPDSKYLGVNYTYEHTRIFYTGDWKAKKWIGPVKPYRNYRYSIEFSPDNKYVAFTQNLIRKGGFIEVREHSPRNGWPIVARRRILPFPSVHADRVGELDISPDSNQIAVENGNNVVVMSFPEPDNLVQRITLPENRVIDIEFQRDKALLAVSSLDSHVYIFTAQIDNTPPTSSVNPIKPYWQTSTPITVTATASDNQSGVENVELWYRYSLDNWTDKVEWKKQGWKLYSVDKNGKDGWSWSFDALKDYGYYEFYSIATDKAGNREEPPREMFVDNSKENFQAARRMENVKIDNAVRLKENIPKTRREGFEEGRLPEDFKTGGDLPWVVTRRNPYEGRYSLESNENLEDGESNWVEVQASFLKNGLVSFDYLVRSQRKKDIARFYIDDNLYYENSGLLNWAHFSENLSAGSHTFRWTYSKDKSGSAEEDAHFVDNLVFKNLKSVPRSGVLASRILDSGRFATEWSTISWEENTPDNTKIILQTRTGNHRRIDDTWGGWSRVYENREGENITSSSSKYIQYRAILMTENENMTPVLRRVEITYPEVDVGFRLAKNIHDVAVIFAEPNKSDFSKSGEYFRELTRDVRSYYDEVSYGGTSMRFDFYPFLGGWYELSTDWKQYVDKGDDYWTYKTGLWDDAVDSAGINVDSYDAVITVGPTENIGDRWYRPFTFRSGFLHRSGPWKSVLLAEDTYFRGIFSEENYSWSHELGHALSLPDLYPLDRGILGKLADIWSWDTEGNIDNWGIMGTDPYVFPVHFSSWSKEKLGWLNYSSFTSFLGWVESLPTKAYNSSILRYSDSIHNGTDYYIFEVRSYLDRYSRWDRSTSWTSNYTNALVVYKYHDPIIGDSSLNIVKSEKTGKNYFSKINGEWQWIVRPDKPSYWFDDPGLRLKLLDEKAAEKSYQIKIHAQEHFSAQWENKINVRLNPYPVWWPKRRGTTRSAPLGNIFSPDLDLHAYTYYGAHVGMNYENGEYERGINGAVSSGEFWNSSESISVPDNQEVYFFVSSHDVSTYIENGGVLKNENGFYSLSVWNFDENMDGSVDYAENQLIKPGSEVVYPLRISRKPDGTYEVSVKRGVNVLSLESWRNAVQNLPDNIFINNPEQRKKALKNKFEAVFGELSEAKEKLRGDEKGKVGNGEKGSGEDEGKEIQDRKEEVKEHYRSAIKKLEHDILEKLDADGKADWTTEPVLVQEIKGFIGYLRYKITNGSFLKVKRVE